MIYENEVLRKSLIRYLDANWRLPITGAWLAKEYQYTEQYFQRKFRAIFGMPVAQYVRKLKLRRAALEMCRQNAVTNIWEIGGFSSAQSFSKAFFREFGMSPREFLKSGQDVPDMPMKHEIEGYEINVRYWEIGGVSRGKTFPSCQVVFSVDLQGNETTENVQHVTDALLAYIYEEWSVLNDKDIRIESTAIQGIEDGVLSVSVPVLAHQRGSMVKTGPQAWNVYIDLHLKDNLTVKELAEHFYYSERHFVDTFHLYYGMPPGTYIRKRRLYLIANELRCGKYSLPELLDRYGIRSEQTFRKDFEQEFLTTPEDYRSGPYQMEDLYQYYVMHHKEMRVNIMEMKPVFVLGRDVKLHQRSDILNNNIMEDIIYNLKHEIPGSRLQKSSHVSSKMQGKIILWQNGAEEGELRCLCGQEADPVVRGSEGMQPAWLEGGRYAVVSSDKESDANQLMEQYRKLYRCAFYGWIHDHWNQVDFERLTYIRYVEDKLYFYIPIKDEIA